MYMYVGMYMYMYIIYIIHNDIMYILFRFAQ